VLVVFFKEFADQYAGLVVAVLHGCRVAENIDHFA
jgi:hypothetical protein